MSRTSTAPARRRRTAPQAWRPSRDRRELVITAGVVAAILLGTVLLIWLMRPETENFRYDGGIIDRQARIAWWVVIVAGVLIGVFLFLRRRGLLLAAGVALLVTALIATPLWIYWPGGIVKEYTAPRPPTPVQPQDGGLVPVQPQPFPASPTTAPAVDPNAVPTDPAPAVDPEPAPAPEGNTEPSETAAPTTVP